MFAASSAAGATLQPVARILFIIFSVQIMITSCQNAQFDGPFVDKYYPNDQCPHIDGKYVLSLSECLDWCLSRRWKVCTAVNYRVRDTYCQLRACDMPVPPPARDIVDWDAYSLKPADFDGPFVDKYFLNSQCPVYGNVTFTSEEECLDKCLSHRGSSACTAINYYVSTNDCKLLTCTLPVTPAGDLEGYNAYTLKPEPPKPAPNPCEQGNKCLKKDGKCILRKDWAICDGHVNSELCSGKDCGCCYPKAPKKCGESKKCSKVNGVCIEKKKWKDCDGKLKKKWCDGKKCGCCYQ